MFSDFLQQPIKVHLEGGPSLEGILLGSSQRFLVIQRPGADGTIIVAKAKMVYAEIGGSRLGLGGDSWIRNPATGHYYTLTKPMTWRDAQVEAERLGGNLVTIDNAAENSWLVRTFARAPELDHPDYTDPVPGWVHIGLIDWDKDGKWAWAAGQKTTFSHWAPGEPNGEGAEARVEMRLVGELKGFWNDKEDRRRLPGIVERDRKPE